MLDATRARPRRHRRGRTAPASHRSQPSRSGCGPARYAVGLEGRTTPGPSLPRAGRGRGPSTATARVVAGCGSAMQSVRSPRPCAGSGAHGAARPRRAPEHEPPQQVAVPRRASRRPSRRRAAGPRASAARRTVSRTQLVEPLARGAPASSAPSSGSDAPMPRHVRSDDAVRLGERRDHVRATTRRLARRRPWSSTSGGPSPPSQHGGGRTRDHDAGRSRTGRPASSARAGRSCGSWWPCRVPGETDAPTLGAARAAAIGGIHQPRRWRGVGSSTHAARSEQAVLVRERGGGGAGGHAAASRGCC